MAKTSARPQRIPVSGARNILTVAGKDPNYEYRWVNDSEAGMRIERFKEGGWELVNKDAGTKVGDKVVDQGSIVGSVVTRYVGQGTTSVLMRIPKEWYDEDQAAKAALLDEQEDAMRDPSMSGDYGSFTIQRKN